MKEEGEMEVFPAEVEGFLVEGGEEDFPVEDVLNTQLLPCPLHWAPLGST